MRPQDDVADTLLDDDEDWSDVAVDLPHGTHLPPWNFHVLSSAGMMSTNTLYWVWGSKPVSLYCSVGNMRRPCLVIIISVVCELNRVHKRVFVSSMLSLGEFFAPMSVVVAGCIDWIVAIESFLVVFDDLVFFRFKFFVFDDDTLLELVVTGELLLDDDRDDEWMEVFEVLEVGDEFDDDDDDDDEDDVVVLVLLIDWVDK